MQNNLVTPKKYYLCSRISEIVLQKKIGPVVQLVRKPACHAGGREFESRPDRQSHANCVAFFMPKSYLNFWPSSHFFLIGIIIGFDYPQTQNLNRKVRRGRS